MTSVDPDLLRPERAPTPGRIGKWARTASGRIVFPRDPRPEDIVVEDVAHHLSLICRFGGAVRTLYVVGEHAVRVSRVVEMLGGTKAEQFHGLHHDDSEYVLGDWIWPLKHSEEMEAARGLEKRWEDAIAERFGLAKEMPAIVTPTTGAEGEPDTLNRQWTSGASNVHVAGGGVPTVALW